jgi:fluoroacetyl-CoA thioesterase
MAAIRVGARATLLHTVGEEDSAARWGNDVPVLATPVLLWLGEIASMRAIEDGLEPDEMSVGTAHDAAHLAPTPVGATVSVEAELVAVDRKLLRFSVEGRDERGTVYRGTHERAVVSASRFRERVAAAGSPA